MAEERRPYAAAAGWLAFLGPFFFVTYGFANAYTATRTDVPALVFDWERHIPFLAWTILPYWTIDVFYAASVFLCRTRAGLRTHAPRLLSVQIPSVACFPFSSFFFLKSPFRPGPRFLAALSALWQTEH